MNAADILVRPYRPDDESAFIELLRELQAHERALFERMKPAEAVGRWYVEGLLEQCATARGTILVAQDHDGLAGYAVVLTDVVREDDDETEYRYALVADLMVTQRCRGRGLGRRLLEECDVLARAAGARWLRVTVLAANAAALGLYRSFGFREHLMELEKPLAP